MTVKTNLQTPPEYRGGNAEPYVRLLYNWVLRYHMTLEPLVQEAAQLKADIAALSQLTQTITNPPTQAEVEAIQTKLNALIALAET